MPWVKPKRSVYDNSDCATKVSLREQYAGMVGAGLCLDLFCGSGTMTSAVWAPRFERVVCVDKQRKQLEQLPELPNVTAYQGDNQKLLTGLLVKYGAPDLVDLDAYGSPDPLAHVLLTTSLTNKRFAVVGTDGSMTQRTRGSKDAVPACHGFGPHLSVAQFSGGMDTAAVRAHTLMSEWAAVGGKAVVDFTAYTWRYMMYWAILVEPQDVT